SPALSMDRIEVYFQHNKLVTSVCISPKNREDMVKALQKRNGQITYKDNRK
ncbi:MAG: PH domain-containing protein, partial [Tyzzerella sp.]|nr:PH domain-containing protein [Tyzzerella sp.]